MVNWVPLGADSNDFDTLHEGVPIWLRGSLGRWLLGQLASSNPYGDIRVNVKVLEAFDLETRNVTPRLGRLDGDNIFVYIQTLEEHEYFVLIDFLLSEMSSGYQPDANNLREILESGGSIWTVGERNGTRGLERRVSKPVSALAETLISKDDAAAQYLNIAWKNCYGIDPDPDISYSNSVKAVESKLLHRISPNDSVATLGKALGILRTREKWRLSIEPQDKRSDEDDLFYQMIRALWEGQTNRHGDNVVRSQTQQEAEIAVTLAMSIIHLFNIAHQEDV